VCQSAVSLALLTAGGFCARAVLRAAVMDPGYSYDRLLRVSIDPALASYDKARQHERVETSLARLRAMPGVVSAAAATRVAFSYSQESRRVVRPGRSDVARQEPYFAGVSSDHFRTLGLPILHGREFTPAEDAAGSQPRVAIIDEPLAQRLFGNENPIGQTIASPVDDEDPLAENNAPLEIVGVVAGVREDLTSHAPVLHLYVPTPLFSTGNMHLLVRTHGGSDGEMLTALRREIRRVDDKMPVTELTTMRDDHAQNGTLWLMRTAANTLSALGALALVLAAVGLYGVKAFNVAQRTREIGVRLALGARPREIAIMLLRDDVKVTLLGVALGLPMAVALGHLFSSAMFQLDVYDPLILVAAPLVLIACAALATYLPARRAMRVSPLTALRHE
jgi:putative ABC transport system permease protein